jgi:hypothetical protein
MTIIHPNNIKKYSTTKQPKQLNKNENKQTILKIELKTGKPPRGRKS